MRVVIEVAFCVEDFEVTKDGLVLTALSPDTTVDAVKALTGAPFKTASDLKTYAL